MYYLSAEFLMGRTLTNAVHNMGLQGEYAEVSERTACSTFTMPMVSARRQA